jgi:hypothetical protein
MSQRPISLSPDLSRLRDEGYEIEIVSGHLVLHSVPYVNSRKEVRRGALVSELTLAADVAQKPSTHVVMFAGEFPCDKHGRPLEKISAGTDVLTTSPSSTCFRASRARTATPTTTRR